MKSALIVPVAALALAFTPQSAQGVLTYAIQPYTLSGGFFIDGGSITVTDDAHLDGLLTAAEIVGHTVNVTDTTGSFTISPIASIVIQGTVNIDANQILVPFVPSDSSSLTFDEYPSTSATAFWQADGSFQSFAGVRDRDGSTGGTVLLGQQDIVVATRSTDFVVPEPATATLGLLALGGLGAMTRRRRA